MRCVMQDFPRPNSKPVPRDQLGQIRPPRRWLAPWKDSPERPVLYHCIARIVDRRFVLDAAGKERLLRDLRSAEGFSGCRILAFCLMSNHCHLLLEVPPPPPAGWDDDSLLARLACLYKPAEVTRISHQLAEARRAQAQGRCDGRLAREIHQQYTWRMHDLSQFMKTVLQRFTRWHNRRENRSGVLWESRFKSLILEDGAAARAVAAYIDLNPVRAGIVAMPEAYRWSSYGEAIAGGTQARAGLVRAWMAHHDWPAEDAKWSGGPRGGVAAAYRNALLETTLAIHQTESNGESETDTSPPSTRATPRESLLAEIRAELAQLTPLLQGLAPSSDAPPDAPAALAAERSGEAKGRPTLLARRVRHFSDGGMLGSRAFVEDAFETQRSRFGPKRRSGARKLRGQAAGTASWLWSLRDLRKNTTTPP